MKWQTLRHNGVTFPPEHPYRGLTVKIADESVKLSPEIEEMLFQWAKKKDTPYVLDPVFQENFLSDLRPRLGERFARIQIADIDFAPLNAWVEREKTANLSPEERKRRAAARKREREELKAKFGHARVDDIETELGNYLVEPPGLLMGRGQHPLRGRWKKRVNPEDVTLNLDEDAPLPETLPGHQWGEIVHDHDSMWIAAWGDELAKKRKYIWLADSSHLKQEREKEKFDKAQALEGKVEKVRAEILAGIAYANTHARHSLERDAQHLHARERKLNDALAEANAKPDPEARTRIEKQLDALVPEREKLEKRRAQISDAETKKRKIATVAYLIDRLAMRVGDEKDEDEADTVGASTLRVEHIVIGDDKIEFDFLGKDSVPWQKFLPIGGTDRILADNLRDFSRGKQGSEQIFEDISSVMVNKFLGSIVPGLTAKVFRTYTATKTVRDYLHQHADFKPDASLFEKEYAAKMANLEAAIACNHKRTPPKNWEESLRKKAEAYAKLAAVKPDPAKYDALVDKRAAALEKLRAGQPPAEASAQRAVEKAQGALAKLRGKPADKKRDKKIKQAERALKHAQAKSAQVQKSYPARIRKAEAALDQARAARERATTGYAERVEKARLQLELAQKTRDYNLNTSLKNYIDPRIYKAWGDHVGCDWMRLYSTSLQRKLAWVKSARVRWEK